MSYNNNNRTTFNTNNYNRNNSNRNNSNSFLRTKKSGAKYSKIGEGKFRDYPIINAWLKTKNGLITFKVAPYHGTREVDSKTGNRFINMIVEVRDGFNVSVFPCMFSVKTRYVIIDKLGLLITPKGQGVTGSGKTVFGAVLKLNKNGNNSNYNF